MDTRKVTFFATIAAIVLVAVGIGYAYTAVTTNSGNNASPEYITLVQGGTGSYQFSAGSNVYWNTTDYKDGGEIKTDFTIAAVTETLSGMTAVKIGDSFTLVAETVGASTAATQVVEIIPNNIPAPFIQSTAIKATVVFKVTNGDVGNDQYLWVTAANQLTLYDGGSPTATVNQITLYKGTDSAYKTATVQAYYVTVDPKITVTHASGVNPVGPSTKPLENSALSFKISNGSYNPGDRVAVTGITLDKYEVALHAVAAQTATVNVSFTPASPTDQGLTVYSNNTSIVTASVSGTVVTLTVPATPSTGTTNVVITSQEGGFTQVVKVYSGDNIVNLTLGSNMSLTSGSLLQAVNDDANMAPIVLTAAAGYYFPENYTVGGLTVTVIGEGSGNSVMLTGAITADVTVTLTGATEVTP